MQCRVDVVNRSHPFRVITPRTHPVRQLINDYIPTGSELNRCFPCQQLARLYPDTGGNHRLTCIVVLHVGPAPDMKYKVFLKESGMT